VKKSSRRTGADLQKKIDRITRMREIYLAHCSSGKYQGNMNVEQLLYYPTPGRGTGYCFWAISFFLSLFLCQQHYEKTAGPICLKFSGKVWSDYGMT